MTDRIRFDLAPRADFADRLEADLLRAIGATTNATATNNPARVTPRRDNDEELLMTITADPPSDQNAVPDRRGWLSIAAAAAVLVVLVAGIWAVTRTNDDDDAAAAHDVEFVVKWAVGETIIDCPTDTTSPTCGFTYEGPATATFEGDVSGNAYQSIVWNNSEDFPDRAVRHEERVATFVVSGTVAGCGKGEFLMVETINLVSGPDRNWPAGTATGTWNIVQGSGRGELRSIAGGGTSAGLPPTLDSPGRTLTGTVTCTPPPDLSSNAIIAPLGTVDVPTDRATVTAEAGALPDGTYRIAFSAADLDHLEPDIVHDFTDGGSLEITLNGGAYTVQGFLPSGAKDGEPFQGIYQVTGNTMVWLQPASAQVPGTDGINVFEWSVEGDTLAFSQVDGKHRDPWFALPWTRVS